MDDRLDEIERRLNRLEWSLRLATATTLSEFRDHITYDHREPDASQGTLPVAS